MSEVKSSKIRSYQRLLASASLLLPLAAIALGLSPVAHAKQTKQLVCHVNSKGETEAKMLPSKAVKAHLRHGDLDAVDYYLDADGDGYASDAENTSFFGCAPPDERYTAIIFDGLDCDDGDEGINPGQTEVTGNSKDDDCDPSTQDEIPEAPMCKFGDNPLEITRRIGSALLLSVNTELVDHTTEWTIREQEGNCIVDVIATRVIRSTITGDVSERIGDLKSTDITNYDVQNEQSCGLILGCQTL